MRAWVFIAAATILYTQVRGSADFGDKANSPVTTESPKSSAESSQDSSKERSSPESKQTADSDQQGHLSGSSDILKLPHKPTKSVSNSEQTPYYSTPSPQEPYRQHLESPYNVNSLYNVDNNENTIAALYEATRAAYVRSNLYSKPAAPYFQNPSVPYSGALSRQPLINSSPVDNPLAHQHVPPQPVVHHHTNNRFTQPLQPNRVQETSFVGISNNNFDDYDDGSYDPYKYGDYLYFDNDEDAYNQDHRKQNSPLNVLPTPYQQPQPLHGNPSNHITNNYNNYQSNYDHYNQNYQNAHTPSTNFIPQLQQQSQSFNSNPINQHTNYNNYQQDVVQPRPQNVFQPQHVHSPVQPNNTPSYSKDAKNFLDDSHNYQVEAAKQYLKEIEEAQDYAKRVLASSNSPAPHQTSQLFSVQADYDNQNQHSSTPNTEGRYNNFPSESSHYKQTAHPSQQLLQAMEVNTMANVNHATSQDRGREYFYNSPIPSSHQEPPRQIFPSHQGPARQSSNVPSPGPTAVPVLLPSGFLADTEEVRLAKIAHLHLVLDTLKTVSTYRSQYTKRKPINSL